MTILSSKKSMILRHFLRAATFSILASLLFFSVAEAHYWEITYAPEEVGVVLGDNEDFSALLTSLNCPYVTIYEDALTEMNLLEYGVKALFVEGSETFSHASGSKDTEKIAAIVQFVRDGGQLFVSGKADLLLKALNSGVRVYAPTRPGEEIYQSASTPLPIAVAHDLKGALKTHMGLSSISLPYMTRRPQHTLLNLESVYISGCTTEATALYVLRWIEVTPWGADWRTEGVNFITSFIYPTTSGLGKVHYVNYDMDLAYRNGAIGEKLVKYQIGNTLDRAGLVAEDIFNKNTTKSVVEKGEIIQEADARYAYNAGYGNISLVPHAQASSLRINELADAEDLIVWKMDDDIVLSVKGTTGTVKIPGWYSDGQKLSTVEFAGKTLPAAYLEERAVEKELEIDITPISFDALLRPAADQIEIYGTEGNDYIFGNKLDNVMYGKGGSDIYYYRLGEGHDTIVNTREKGERSVLRFDTDITSKDVAVKRSEDDMIFALPDGGSVTVQGWFEDVPTKLSRVELFDGTFWDVRDLEKLAAGEMPKPRGLAVYEEFQEIGQKESTESSSGSSAGCNTGTAAGLWVGLLSLLFVGARKRRVNGKLFILVFLAFFSLGSRDAFAREVDFYAPTVSLAPIVSDDSRGTDSSVVITPGYAHLGNFTKEMMKAGFMTVWGVNSLIEDHVIVLADIYPKDEIDNEYIREIQPLVTLPQNIDLVVGKKQLATVTFASSDDLEVGTYTANVGCIISLPSELGGGTRETYVEYEFDIVLPPVDVNVLGRLIGRELDGGFQAKDGSMITEQYLSTVEYSGETIRKGFTADGVARLIVRLQSEFEPPVKLSIPELASYNITAETLDKQPCNLNAIQLQPVEGQEDLYQASIVLKAPEEWPAHDSDKSLQFTIEATQPDLVQPEPIPFDLVLAKPPVVLVHGIWASANSWYSNNNVPGPSGTAIGDYLYNSHMDVLSNSYDNFRGPSEIVPLNSGHENYTLFYKRFVEPAYLMMTAQSIECARIDVVGHSMGGLMTKRFMQQELYRTDDNYNKGAIRRLITLGTPHWGSPFPSYLSADPRYLDGDYFTVPVRRPGESDEDFEKREKYSLFARSGLGVVKSILTGVRKQIGSAISDLRVGSPIIRELNEATYEVPMHIIAGDSGNEQIIEPLLSGPATLVMWPYNHQNLFGDMSQLMYGNNDFVAENSDSVVGVSSALWVGSGMRTDNQKHVYDGMKHTGMGQQTFLGVRVKELLAGPETNFMVPEKPTGMRFKDELPVTSGDGSVAPAEIFMLLADKSIAEPGDTVIFTVSMAAARAGAGDVVFGTPYLFTEEFGNHLMERSGDIYEYQLELPENAAGAKTFLAIASGDGGYAISNAYEITIQPELSGLSMLRFAQAHHLGCSEGAKLSSVVLGLLPDGGQYNLSGANMGTTYSSSDPSVAAVTVDGEITALKAGKTTITAQSEGGVGAIMYLTVYPSEKAQNPNPSTPGDMNSSSGGGCDAVNDMYLGLLLLPIILRRASANKR